MTPRREESQRGHNRDRYLINNKKTLIDMVYLSLSSFLFLYTILLLFNEFSINIVALFHPRCFFSLYVVPWDRLRLTSIKLPLASTSLTFATMATRERYNETEKTKREKEKRIRGHGRAGEKERKADRADAFYTAVKQRTSKLMNERAVRARPYPNANIIIIRRVEWEVADPG